jgi:cell division protein FtsN
MRQQICKQRGSTGVGLMIGLILGLLVAVMVAVFVTKAPVPWVTKVGKHQDSKVGENKPVELKVGSEMPDPNKSLNSKNSKIGEAPAPGTAQGETAQSENKDSILGLLGSLGKENTPATKEPSKEPERPAAKVTESKPAESKAAEPKVEKPAEPESTRYMLQAGAFRDRDDADGMKGKLALLGYEARITTIERDGNTIYRVRTGPFKQLDDANSVRKRLADGGVETSLVPLRQPQ